jgi:Uma2 family endonuclease
MTVAAPQDFRFTRDQYYRMSDMGFFQGRRVELIEGEIIQMPAQKNPHALSLTLSDYRIRAAFDGGFFVRVQLPFRVGDLSEPEPDLAVIVGDPRDYRDHPDQAALLVEVADTTLDFDRKRKGPLYAASGVADYWIVNLIDRCVEVYRDPAADPVGGDFRYASVRTYFSHESIAPLAKPSALVAVKDLLP